MLSKFIHGWLPTGSKRALAAQGDSTCPHCTDLKTTDHLLECNNPKIARGVRMTFLASKIYHAKRGKPISHIFVAYLHHVLNNSTSAQFEIIYPSHITFNTRARIKAAVDIQTKIGCSPTLRGYLTKRWSEVILSDPEQEMTESQSQNWTKNAISQIWSLVLKTWEEWNETLHRGQHEDIVHSAYDEKFKQLYLKQHTIHTRDSHLFSQFLPDLMKANLGKKKKFLEKPDFLFEESARMAQKGQK